MKDFDPTSYEAFEEAMAERYDFARCKRSDGSTYGIPNDANCKSGRKTSSSDSKDKKKNNEVAMITDAQLEAAARSQQERSKQQGIPIPQTQGVVDLFKIGSKKGLV